MRGFSAGHLARLVWSALPYLVAAVAVEHYAAGIVAEMIGVRPDIIDFDVYYRAAQAFAQGHPIYDAWSGCCFDPSAMDGYTYPPVLAVVLSPLTAFPVGVAGRIFLGASQLCLAGAIVVMHRTVRTMVSRATQLWLLAAVLLFQPIHAGNFGLQVSNVLLLLFALAAHAYTRGDAARAGIPIGLGTALKVSPALVLPALLCTDRRSAVRTLAGFAAGALVPLLLVWIVVPGTPAYFTEVAPRFAGGVISQYSRSLPAVVLRTVAATGSTPPAALAMLFHAVQLGGIALTLVLCRRCVSTPAGRAATFAAFLAVMPITEAVAWDHHMAADALALVLIAPSLRRWTAAWCAALTGFALMSVNQLELASMLQRAGFDPPHGAGYAVFVLGSSVNLVGMALLYAATLRAARGAQPGVMRPTYTTPGPWTPRVRMPSMSPERLSPVWRGSPRPSPSARSVCSSHCAAARHVAPARRGFGRFGMRVHGEPRSAYSLLVPAGESNARAPVRPPRHRRPQTDPQRSRLQGVPRDGSALAPPAPLPRVRARRLLRLVAEHARDEALPRHRASPRPLVRARRGVVVVLRRRGRLRGR